MFVYFHKVFFLLLATYCRHITSNNIHIIIHVPYNVEQILQFNIVFKMKKALQQQYMTKKSNFK